MKTEKRLFDANALGIGKAKREIFDNPVYADGWNSAIDIIENAPTVDAVEVVRCKDCKYYMNHIALPNNCQRHDIFITAEDFCSYGERRDND